MYGRTGVLGEPLFGREEPFQGLLPALLRGAKSRLRLELRGQPVSPPTHLSVGLRQPFPGPDFAKHAFDLVVFVVVVVVVVVVFLRTRFSERLEI